MRPGRRWYGNDDGADLYELRTPHSSTHLYIYNCTKRDPFSNKVHLVNAIRIRECQHQLKKSSSSLAQLGIRVVQ